MEKNWKKNKCIYMYVCVCVCMCVHAKSLYCTPGPNTTFSFDNHNFVIGLWVCFIKCWFVLFFFSFQIKVIYYFSFTSVSMKISSSMHVAENGIISFSFMGNITLYVITFSLSIHLLMNTWVFSMSWLF